MLLAAYSMARTEPKADKLVYKIAKGFRLIGEHTTSTYYMSRLIHFYPQSKYTKKIKKRHPVDYRYPVESHGKDVEIYERMKI